METNKIYFNYMKGLKSAKNEFAFELEDNLFNALLIYEDDHKVELTTDEMEEAYKAVLQRAYVELVSELGDTFRDIYRVQFGEDKLEL